MLRCAALFALLVSVVHVAPAHADDYPLTFRDRPLQLMDVRLGMGAIIKSPTGSVEGPIFEPALLWRSGLTGYSDGWNPTLMAEVGGSFWRREATDGAMVVAGVGLGFSRGPVLFGVVPALVHGSYRRDPHDLTATGYRVTSTFEIMQIAGIQAVYQSLELGGVGQEEQAMLMGSLNLMPLVLLARVAMGG